MGRLVVRTQYGSVLYVCAKFEADISIRSKVMGSQNFEIRSRDPGHAYLWVVCGPDVIHVCAKFEADISIRSKDIRGSQNFEIWSRDSGHAHLGSFYNPDAVGDRPLCLCQI